MFQRQALVIGNSAYDAVQRKPCVHDANDMAMALRSIGFLTHCATDLNFNDMTTRTNRFAQSIEPHSIVVFYFSGHGIHYDGNNYIIPTDNAQINGANIRNDAINVEEFITTIANKAPRAVIIILDCCRPYREPGRSRPFFDRETLGLMQGLAPIRPPPSTFIAYSGSEAATSTVVSIKGRNSVFTHHLVRHIATPNVDIDDIFAYVASKVQRDTGNRQIPIRYNSIYGKICLVGSPYSNQHFAMKDHTSRSKMHHPNDRQAHSHPRPNVFLQATAMPQGSQLIRAPHLSHMRRTSKRNTVLPKNNRLVSFHG